MRTDTTVCIHCGSELHTEKNGVCVRMDRFHVREADLLECDCGKTQIVTRFGAEYEFEGQNCITDMRTEVVRD